MDLTGISKTTPISPEVECDGWYAYCVRCTTEIEPTDNVCPHCNQAQDWSWFNKTKTK